MLTVGPLFGSVTARNGEVVQQAAQWGMAGVKRHRRRFDSSATRPGDSGWWCAEMRSVLWATALTVAATALLLFGVPTLF